MLIHMGWVGTKPSSDVLAAVDRVRKAAPACYVMFHADESMVPPEWLQVSSLLRPQMRSDVQRHCILKKWGGLWLDIDVRMLADPAVWTAGWDRYTVSRVAEGANTIGTDIIYVPHAWSGWGVVDAYIDETLKAIAATKRVKIFALAGRMIEACSNSARDEFTIMDASDRFPISPANCTHNSVVCRGFDRPASMPSMIQRAKNFTAAAARHVAAGMPKATDEEIERRFSICQQCQHFDGKACQQCGCPIVRERRFVSKLSWANEKCPIGKW